MQKKGLPARDPEPNDQLPIFKSGKVVGGILRRFCLTHEPSPKAEKEVNQVVVTVFMPRLKKPLELNVVIVPEHETSPCEAPHYLCDGRYNV